MGGGMRRVAHSMLEMNVIHDMVEFGDAMNALSNKDDSDKAAGCELQESHPSKRNSDSSNESPPVHMLARGVSDCVSDEDDGGGDESVVEHLGFWLFWGSRDSKPDLVLKIRFGS